ncbi:MAG TPA: hypothetical protein EYH44_01670 [Thermoprotei archaeon]|nr:hypothetical protein [Thermoprotei archaeon]
MIIRISNLLGESILLFIGLSIFSLLSLSLFIPVLNIGYQESIDTYIDGYSYGYIVSYLFSDSRYIYLYNGGRELEHLSKIYLDGELANVNIEYFNGSTWVGSTKIPSNTIFRLSINQDPNIVHLIVLDQFVIRVEVKIQ